MVSMQFATKPNPGPTESYMQYRERMRATEAAVAPVLEKMITDGTVERLVRGAVQRQVQILELLDENERLQRAIARLASPGA